MSSHKGKQSKTRPREKNYRRVKQDAQEHDHRIASTDMFVGFEERMIFFALIRGVGKTAHCILNVGAHAGTRAIRFVRGRRQARCGLAEVFWMRWKITYRRAV